MVPIIPAPDDSETHSPCLVRKCIVHDTREHLLFFLLGMLLFQFGICHGQEVQLENDVLKIVCDRERSCSLIQIEDIATSTQFLSGRTIPLWELVWRSDVGLVLSLRADSVSVPSLRTDEREGEHTLMMTWGDIALGDGTASVTVLGRLREQEHLSEWTISVDWTDENLRLLQIDFPCVGGISRHGTNDMLTIPRFWGCGVRDPLTRLKRYELVYPCPASMQFWSYIGNGTGMYLATYDPDSWMKRWLWSVDSKTATGEWRAIHYPAWSTDPVVSYRLPYPVIIGAFSGDWQDAAKLYRQWALGQKWCNEGRIVDRPSPPDSFENTALWLKYYGEPGKVLCELLDHKQYLDVPMAVHYYRYPISEFDQRYPEFLPAKSGFLRGIRDMKDMGTLVIPYTQGAIWDMTTDSWRLDGGAEAAAKKENGDFYIWPIKGHNFAWMCPSAQGWQEKVFDFSSKLIWDYGTDGVYLDVLSAGMPKMCYDTTHGHLVHGGTYWGQGNRGLLESLRERIREKSPEAVFLTEEICEIYLDRIDGFLTLDVTRGGNNPPLNVIPLFTAVYHDYTIQYGSDSALGMETDPFCALLAMHFVWGVKPTLSEQRPPPIGERLESASYLKEVVSCYHQVGKRFLLYGEWLPAPDVSAPVRSLEFMHKQEVGVRMPTVLQSLWRAPDGSVGLVLTNWTGQRQSISLSVDPSEYGSDPQSSLRLLWPREVSDNGSISNPRNFGLDLPPRSVFLYEFSSPQQSATAEDMDDAIDESHYLCLRPGRDGVYRPLTVDPSSIWYAERAELRMSVGGRLTVQKPPRDGDFILLQQHPVRIMSPVSFTVRSAGRTGLMIEISEAESVILEKVRGYHVVARTPAGEILPEQHKDGMRINSKGLPMVLLVTPEKAEQDTAGARIGAWLCIEQGGWNRAVPYVPQSFKIQVMNGGSEGSTLSWEDPSVEISAHLRGESAVIEEISVLQNGTVSDFLKSTEIGEYLLEITDRELAGHTITIHASVTVERQGRKMEISNDLTVPVDLPFLMDVSRRDGIVMAGESIHVDVELLNVLNRPLQVDTGIKTPEGWKVEPSWTVPTTLPATTDQYGRSSVQFEITPPLGTEGEKKHIQVKTSYSAGEKGASLTSMSREVIPRLKPLPGAESMALSGAASPRIRGKCRGLFHLSAGGRCELSIRNIRVTRYTDEVRYQILDEKLEELTGGIVEPGGTAIETVRARETGTFLILLDTGRSSCIVTSQGTPVWFEASPQQHLGLFRQNSTLFFSLPKTAKSFSLNIDCGGYTEPVDIRLLDGKGDVIFDQEGVMIDGHIEIEPASSLRNVWQLDIRPKEDVSIFFEGDVKPYLSVYPIRIPLGD